MLLQKYSFRADSLWSLQRTPPALGTRLIAVPDLSRRPGRRYPCRRRDTTSPLKALEVGQRTAAGAGDGEEVRSMR